MRWSVDVGGKNLTTFLNDLDSDLIYKTLAARGPTRTGKLCIPLTNGLNIKIADGVIPTTFAQA